MPPVLQELGGAPGSHQSEVKFVKQANEDSDLAMWERVQHRKCGISLAVSGKRILHRENSNDFFSLLMPHNSVSSYMSSMFPESLSF